jgi:hypothetical protein
MSDPLRSAPPIRPHGPPMPTFSADSVHSDTSTRSSLLAMIDAATTAPSSMNSQPWRFRLDEERKRISVDLDPMRAGSATGGTRVMARIACGAAIENMLLFARASGWQADLQLDSGEGVAVIQLRRIGTGQAAEGWLLGLLRGRSTNRRIYQRRSLPERVLRSLSDETPPLDEVTTHWVTNRDRVARIARIVGEAAAIAFQSRQERSRFLTSVHFGSAIAQDGIPSGALELSPPRASGCGCSSERPIGFSEWPADCARSPRIPELSSPAVPASASESRDVLLARMWLPVGRFSAHGSPSLPAVWSLSRSCRWWRLTRSGVNAIRIREPLSSCNGCMRSCRRWRGDESAFFCDSASLRRHRHELLVSRCTR